MLTDASAKINRLLNVLIHVLNKLIGNKVTYSCSLWNYWEEFPEWEELIIADFHHAAAVEVETVGEHERSFQKWFSNMVDLAARGKEVHGFQSMVMACGESVNEDQALGQLHLSKNLKDDFLKERLLMTEDALLGQMKIHSYDYVAKDYAKQLAEDREAKEEERKLEAELFSEDGSNSDAVSKVNTDNGRKIIWNYLQAGFCVGGGKMELVNLRWQDLPTRLSSQGLAIVGWAHKVPFLDKDSKPNGIKSIKIRMERRDMTKLQDYKLPVAVKEAPPADSEQVAACWWFADRTSDYKGTPHVSTPEAGSSCSLTTGSRTKCGQPSMQSVTFDVPPKPTARSSKSSKGKGKQKPSVVVSDTDNDLPLAPTQPPPPTKLRPKGDPKVKKIHIKVGNVEIPVPFVNNSNNDVFELPSNNNDSPSLIKWTSKR
ncbi:hypothetical protein H1R20_g13607, partial [Candolleomyces eurysporus]